MTKKEFNYPNGKAWTEEEVTYLANYPQKSEKEIAEHLGRSVDSVTRKLERMGYKKTQPRSAYWTEEEVNYMYRFYGTRGAKSIAKTLGKTTKAVRAKAARLGLVAYTEYWTMSIVSRAFQVDPLAIHRWHDKFGMPMTRIKRDGEYCYRIKADEFWQWASTHNDLIPWQRYQLGFFADEPENAKQLHDQAQSKANHRMLLTDYEKEKIVSDYRHGHSVKELAAREKRTECAIRHVIDKGNKLYKKQAKERAAQINSSTALTLS